MNPTPESGRTDAGGRKLAVLDIPSNLGLRPPSEGKQPGAAKMASVLRSQGALERWPVTDAGAVEVGPYSPDPDPVTGFRNGPTIVDTTTTAAARVGELLDAGVFPIVLGGDCSVVLGPLLALRRRGRYGLAFVDGHDDYSPPRDTESYAGLYTAAGMDLGLATGHLSPAIADIDGLAPYVAEEDVVHLGLIREDGDTDYARTELFERSRITAFPAYEIKHRGARTVADDARAYLTNRDLSGFWIHVDVDVLDASVMPAVDSPNPFGLLPDHLDDLLTTLLASELALGLDLTIYDPDLDPDRRCAELLVDLLAGVLADEARP